MGGGTYLSELFGLDGKVCVVTGGTRGIGRMVAEGFVRAGAARVHVASRKADAVEATVDELAGLGLGEVLGTTADLSTKDGCDAYAAAVAEHDEAVDVLVNNAGATWGAPLADYPDAAWDKVLALNVKGVFHLTRALHPQLVARATHADPARIINVGSIDGLRVPAMETYAYSASKAAVHHLTRHLAGRLAAEHVTVNAVAPGPFPSKMMQATLDAFEEQIVASTPRARIGEPADMAGVCIWLASRAGAYVTGTVTEVDGGIATTA